MFTSLLLSFHFTLSFAADVTLSTIGIVKMELDPVKNAAAIPGIDPAYIREDSKVVHRTFNRIPRYLFRVQTPLSNDLVNIDKVEARFQTRKAPKPESIEEMIARHVILGDPTQSEFVAFTSSLMWAVAYARNLTDPLGRAPLEEEQVEIFVLETTSFPLGTFSRIWVPPNFQEHSCDYLAKGTLNVRGRCSRTTLAELNSMGLQVICRPFRFTQNGHQNSGGTENRRQELVDTIRKVNALRNQQYVLHYPEDEILEAAVEVAKIFTPELEIPMMVLFLSLCRPPPAEKVLQKIQFEFGSTFTSHICDIRYADSGHPRGTYSSNFVADWPGRLRLEYTRTLDVLGPRDESMSN